MSIRHKNTLVATWTGNTPDVVKTITGCVAGQPLFILYQTTRWGKVDGLNDGQLDDYNYIYYKVMGGANPQYGWSNLGYMGFTGTYHHEELNLILIPTATSVSIKLGTEMDGDDIIYVYRQ